MKLDAKSKRFLREEKDCLHTLAGTLKKRVDLILRLVKSGKYPDLLDEELREASREIRGLSYTQGRVTALETVKRDDYV